MSDKFYSALHISKDEVDSSRIEEIILWFISEYENVKQEQNQIGLVILENLYEILLENGFNIKLDKIKEVYEKLCNENPFLDSMKYKRGHLCNTFEESIEKYIEEFFLKEKKITHIDSIRIRPLIEEVRERYISELKEIIDQRKDNDWIVYVYIKMVKCLEQLNRLDLNYLDFEEIDAICNIIGKRFFGSKMFFDYEINETIDFKLNCLIMNVLSKIVDRKKLKYEFEIPSISHAGTSDYLSFKLLGVSPCRRASLNDSGLFKCVACISPSEDMVDYEEYRLPIVIYKKDDIVLKVEGFEDMMRKAIDDKEGGNMKPIVDAFMFKYL